MKHIDMDGARCRYCGDQNVFMVEKVTEGVPTGEIGRCFSCGELSYLKNRISIQYDENVFEELKKMRKNRDEISLDYSDI